jgi:hypothetical protein
VALSRRFHFSITTRFSGECRYLSSSPLYVLLRFLSYYSLSFPFHPPLFLSSSRLFYSYPVPFFFFVIITVFNFKEDALGGACSTQGEMRNAYTTLVGKLERKRTLGRSRSRWDGSIKTNLKQMGCEDVDISMGIFGLPCV